MRLPIQLLTSLAAIIIGYYSLIYSDFIAAEQSLLIGGLGLAISLLLFQNLGLLKWEMPIEKASSALVTFSMAFLASQLNGGLTISVSILFYVIAMFWNSRNGLLYSSISIFLSILVLEFLFQLIFREWNSMAGSIDLNTVLNLIHSLIWNVLLLVPLAFVQLFVVHPKKIQEIVSVKSASKKSQKIESAETPQPQVAMAIPSIDEYDNHQWSAQQGELAGLLDSVVFFMAKNFKNHTSAAFISVDRGQTFSLNSYISGASERVITNVQIKSGRGIVGNAAEKENGFMSGNLSNYPDLVEYYSENNLVKSIMISPIRDQKYKHCIGLLVVDSVNLQQFTDENKELLNRFTRLSDKLISNARMSLELLKSTKRQGQIYTISKLLADQLYTSDVLKIVINKFQNVFTADRLLFCDYSPQRAQARILKVKGDSTLNEGIFFGIHNTQSLYGQVFKNKKAILVQNITSDQFRFNVKSEDQDGVRSLIIAPITDQSKNVIAVVGLESKYVGGFSEAELTSLTTLTLNASSALDKARLFMKMEKHATIDGLTQIPNHRYFQDLMEKEVAKVQRSDEAKVSLLLMDIDHFKNFNDTYGHPVGDKVLKQVAASISKAIRAADHVARYGGEEFVVILPGADSAEAKISAERVRKAVESMRVENEGQELKVTISIGSATYPDDATDKANLIDNADKALYASKDLGRNRVSLYQTLRNS
jgi:diguanylate cyclase (GGDEF)-like protein